MNQAVRLAERGFGIGGQPTEKKFFHADRSVSESRPRSPPPMNGRPARHADDGVGDDDGVHRPKESSRDPLFYNLGQPADECVAPRPYGDLLVFGQRIDLA